MIGDPADMRQKAYDLFAAGNFTDSLAWLSSIQAQHGADAELANDIAVVLHKLGRNDEALDWFRQAHTLEGSKSTLLVGNLLNILEQKLLDERHMKEQQQRRALEHVESPCQYPGELALAMLRRGSYEESLSGFREAVLLQQESLKGLAVSLLEALYISLPKSVEDSQSGIGLCQTPRYDGDYIHFPEVTLRCCVGDDLFQQQSTDSCFVLGKTPSMIDALLARLQFRPSNILELGVWKGGSLVLFNELFQPKKLAVIDFMTSVVAPLERYVNANYSNISLHLGVNQADQVELLRIHSEVFDHQSFDLVLDDASHFYEESKISFETLFPFVTPNGLYVIEDWGWAQWRGEHWQQNEGGDYFRDRRPLANLTIELALLAASRPGLISEMVVTSGSVYVRRGSEQCTGPICIDELILNRGRPVPLLD